MTPLNYSVTLVAKSPENVNDIRTMFDEVRAVVNALGNDNIAEDAGIDYDKINIPNGTIPFASLGALATGEIIAGNAGVATKRALTGAGTIDATGKFVLGTAFASQGLDKNLPVANTYQSLPSVDIDLGAGLWLLLGTATINQGDASGAVSTELRMRTSAAVVLDSSMFGSVNSGSPASPHSTHHVWHLLIAGGATNVLLDARGAAAFGANFVATAGKLLGVKLG